jgi:hypothetical protein
MNKYKQYLKNSNTNALIRFRQTIDELYNKTEYCTSSGLGKKYYRSYNYPDTEYILKTYEKVEPSTLMDLSRKISFLNQKYIKNTEEQIKLSPARIYDSGVFYRWYLQEQEGKEIDFESQVGNNNSMSVRRIKANYNMWKKAFGMD